MISASDAYRAAIVGDSRRMILKAVIDIIDPDIVYGEILAESESKYSRLDELKDKEFENPPKYATLETDRWALDGSWLIHPDNAEDCLPGIGYASERLSGEDGSFEIPQYVEMQFSNVSILQACSIWFPDNEYDGVPSDFTVEVKQGGTVYHTEAYTGNTAASVSVEGFTVYNPDAIRVTVTKWSLPYRRMRMVEIVPGIYERWDGNMLASFSLKHQGDVSCVSLPYGTCSIRIDNKSRRFEPRRKNGIFQSIEERQGIDVSMACRLPDGTDEYKRLGIFYQHSGGWKTGDNGLTIQWDLVDIVGLLADREFIVPDTLPTTLEGWISALVSQLGVNFEGHYTVDPSYASKSVTVREKEDVQGLKCGEILRYACMATGTWPRADAETGYLAAEPLWDQGNKITLDNLTNYPTMKANSDLSAIIFTLNDGNSTKFVVSGNFTASSDTVSVNNPFIKTQADALTAARLILSAYGGNMLEITGRGDPASEIGDVDTVWLDESQATTARRIQQDFSLTDGVLQNAGSTLLQANGSYLFENRVVLTGNGTWTAPAGVSKIRYILVGDGENGAAGTDGTWDSAGEKGKDGEGGKIKSETVGINEQQVFAYSVSKAVAFGPYTNTDGYVYPYGFTDIASGDVYGRTGVKSPLPGSGDGGAGGAGGVKGNKHTEIITVEKSTRVSTFSTSGDGSSGSGGPPSGGSSGGTTTVTVEVIDNYPGPGEPGVNGATGCIVIWYDKPEGSA